MTVERWSSMKEICSKYNVTHHAVAYWIKNYHLPAVKIGKLWRFKMSEVDEWTRSADAIKTIVYSGPLPPGETMNHAMKKGVGKMPGLVPSFKPLFKLLVDRGIKKKELAEMAGISVATVTKMGKVGNNVNVSVLEKLCLTLKCGLNDIIELVPVDQEGEDVSGGINEEPREEVIIQPVELNPDAVEEYGLSPVEEDIVHFIYERLNHYRQNPPAFMVNQARRDYGLDSIEEAIKNIPTDRFYSLVINEVLEGWGKDGTSFVQKHIPLKLIEDGYFETEEPTERLTMQL